MRNNQKKNLTEKVRRGLSLLSGVVSASSAAEIIGLVYEENTPDEIKDIEAVQAACAWIDSLP